MRLLIRVNRFMMTRTMLNRISKGVLRSIVRQRNFKPFGSRQRIAECNIGVTSAILDGNVMFLK